MTKSNVIFICLTVLALSVGQVLFKLAANDLARADAQAGASWAAWLNPKLLLALVVYAGATLCWLLSLKQVPLHLAYPFAALAFVIVPLLAHFWLGEQLKPSTFVGAALILSGVAVSAWWD